MRLPARIYADLIGKPFAEGGRGPGAFDCLGLALELQRRQGRAVPEFDSTMDEFHRQYHEGGGALGPCVRLEKPVAGCAVLLRMPGDERHLGTMLDPWTMIHTLRELNSVSTESLLAPLWQRRVIGYYEPEASR